MWCRRSWTGACRRHEATDPVDVVVVGYHRSFDYEAMLRANRAIGNGARMVCTNDDATYPTPDGRSRVSERSLASIVTASGVAPIVAGKPNEPMAALIRATIGAAATRDR